MAQAPAAPVRPAQVCQALLNALDAAEGRRRRRKRDTTPDAIGLALKRYLLEQAIKEDPAPESFEQWLLGCQISIGEQPPSPGAVAAMARSVYEEWQLAHSSDSFKSWLDHGAPSDDAFDDSDKSSRP